MNQYYIDKNKLQVDCLKNDSNFDNCLFSSEALEEGYTYKHKKFNRCVFSKVSFKDIELRHVEFTHCVFIDCYFKTVSFIKIDFTNATFIKCDFNNVNITDSSFFYTSWEDTYLKFDEIFKCLPSEFNYRARICKVLARNALKDGNEKEFKKFFYECKNAQENKYIEIILRRKTYYKQNYNIYDSFKHVGKLLFAKANRLIWGYGEKIGNIIFTSVIAIVLFAALYSFAPEVVKIGEYRFANALYLSMSNFITVTPDIALKDFGYKVISVIEGYIGMALMGFFVAALFRNINSR